MAFSGPALRWWYGCAAALGGALFAASDFAARLLDAALGGGGGTAAAVPGGYALWAAASLLALAALQLALVGLYVPHRRTAGAVGWAGFLLASAGTASAFLVVSAYAVAASPLPGGGAELLGAGPPAMLALYFPLFSSGWVLLGAAFLRIPSYPRRAAGLLALGAVAALHPNPATTVVFGAALAWLGLALVRGRVPEERARRRFPLRDETPATAREEEEEEAIALPGASSSYFLLGRRADDDALDRLTLLSLRTTDGSSAVVAFEEAEAAEAFRIIEGLGPEWEAIGALQGTMGLLRSAIRGEVRHVALDPPSALRRGEEEPRLVPVMAFLDHVMGK